MTDLIERLRNAKRMDRYGDRFHDPDKIEAADELERLTAENSELKRECEMYKGVIANQRRDYERLTTENARMREAIKEIYGARHMTCDEGDEETKAINHDAIIEIAREALAAVSGNQTDANGPHSIGFTGADSERDDSRQKSWWCDSCNESHWSWDECSYYTPTDSERDEKGQTQNG